MARRGTRRIWRLGRVSDDDDQRRRTEAVIADLIRIAHTIRSISTTRRGDDITNRRAPPHPPQSQAHLTPSFAAKLEPADLERLSAIEGTGLSVAGYASSKRGPFTVQIVRSDPEHLTGAPTIKAGCGSTAHEAVTRAIENDTEGPE